MRRDSLKRMLQMLHDNDNDDAAAAAAALKEIATKSSERFEL